MGGQRSTFRGPMHSLPQRPFTETFDGRRASCFRMGSNGLRFWGANGLGPMVLGANRPYTLQIMYSREPWFQVQIFRRLPVKLAMLFNKSYILNY